MLSVAEKTKLPVGIDSFEKLRREGFADIVVETEDPDAGIIFELKCSKDAAGLENACQRAMEQIKDRRYTEYLKNDGRDDILIYGIAFYKKRCKVVVEKI